MLNDAGLCLQYPVSGHSMWEAGIELGKAERGCATIYSITASFWSLPYWGPEISLQGLAHVAARPQTNEAKLWKNGYVLYVRAFTNLIKHSSWVSPWKLGHHICACEVQLCSRDLFYVLYWVRLFLLDYSTWPAETWPISTQLALPSRLDRASWTWSYRRDEHVSAKSWSIFAAYYVSKCETTLSELSNVFSIFLCSKSAVMGIRISLLNLSQMQGRACVTVKVKLSTAPKLGRSEPYQ